MPREKFFVYVNVTHLKMNIFSPHSILGLKIYKSSDHSLTTLFLIFAFETLVRIFFAETCGWLLAFTRKFVTPSFGTCIKFCGPILRRKIDVFLYFLFFSHNFFHCNLFPSILNFYLFIYSHSIRSFFKIYFYIINLFILFFAIIFFLFFSFFHFFLYFFIHFNVLFISIFLLS